MIFDKLERAKRYYPLNKYFHSAFEYIKYNNLKTMEPGRYRIVGENAFIIIANDQPKPDFVSKLEVHRKYIDIQMAIEGSFGIKWKALEDCKNIITDYDPKRDAMFFSDTCDFEVMLNPGTFAILMPEDAHFPQPPTGKIKKAVFKLLVK